MEDTGHRLPQQRHERKGMVCGTQYFGKDVLPPGKGNPFIGSHRTCARSFSTAATGSLCRALAVA